MQLKHNDNYSNPDSSHVDRKHIRWGRWRLWRRRWWLGRWRWTTVHTRFIVSTNANARLSGRADGCYYSDTNFFMWLGCSSNVEYVGDDCKYLQSSIKHHNIF
jgi:hypothetical protein